ncbi:MAG: hypothetical protein ACLQU1_33450 [Bryobacteraceae bacterium]
MAVDRHAADYVHTFDFGGLLDDLARVVQHLLSDAELLTILGHLLRLSLGCRHPFEFLHAAARAPGAVGEALHPAGRFFMELVD